MSKKNKILRGVFTGVGIFLAIIIFAAAIIFVPLKGEKHIEIWGPKQEFKLSDIKTVEMKDDDFKILVFADTQLWMIHDENKRCYDEMDKLVEKAKPDLIVTVGDNLSSLQIRFGIKKFIKAMDSYNVPWTVVYGNHDTELPGTTLNWQTEQYMKSKNCFMKKGPSNLYGCGNYVINIVKNDKPVYSLFMFDNGRYLNYGKDKNGNDRVREIYMGHDQIAWYKWNVLGIKKAVGKIVPSMTFSHFGQPEIRETIEKNCILDKDENGNITKITIPESVGSGHFDYLPGTALVNSGFVDTCNELGSTKYFFSGHDHENYGTIKGDDGNTYTYALKTGPSPSPWNKAQKTGGTVITIDSDQNVEIDNIVMNEHNNEK